MSRRARRFALATFVVLAAAAIVGGWLQRLAAFPRELWLDEAGHNLRLLTPMSWSHRLIDIGTDRQPIFEYLTRAWLWFPLFGHQERDLKLPALVCSVVTMILVAVLSYRRLSQRRLALPAVLVGALALVVWCATQPTEVWYAGEARHYAFISLVSLLWTDRYIFCSEPRGRDLWLWTLSVVFASVHFFALAIVGAAWLLEAGLRARARRWRSVAVMLAVTGVLSAFYWWANRYGLRDLFEYTYAKLPPVTTGAELGWRLHRSGELLVAFVHYVATPWWIVLVCAGLACLGSLGAVESDALPARRLLLRLSALWLSIPLVLVVARLRSNWQFPDRYFTPFFGIAWATLLLGWSALAGLPPARWHKASRIATLAACVLVGGATAFGGVTLFRFSRTPSWPARNFSATEHFFEREKARGAPMLVVAEPCFAARVVDLYWSAIGPPPAPGGSIRFAAAVPTCGMAPDFEPDPPAEAIRRFLANPGPKTVALYRFEPPFCTTPPRGTVEVESVPSFSSCLTLIRDPPDFASVKAVADEMQFPLGD